MICNIQFKFIVYVFQFSIFCHLEEFGYYFSLVTIFHVYNNNAYIV